jgi:hypothetical protein
MQENFYSEKKYVSFNKQRKAFSKTERKMGGCKVLHLYSIVLKLEIRLVFQGQFHEKVCEMGW